MAPTLAPGDMTHLLDLVLKYSGPVLGIAALVVSILGTRNAMIGTRNALRVANLALSKADKEEKYELSTLLWKTKELRGKVTLLDDYIFKQGLFTRRQEILDALTVIKRYWVENGAAMEHHLGKENRTLQSFRGLYEIALANEQNQPPPNGQGTWRDHYKLSGYTVEQVVTYAIDELARKNG